MYGHDSNSMVVNKTSLIWRLAIATIALLLALAVYSFVRSQPPELLQPLQVGSTLSAEHWTLFGSAPSLLYVLSIGLIIGCCASTPESARRHVLIWMGIALFLEISQAAFIATPTSDWLSATLPESIWGLFGPYWQRGVFDPLDLLATLAGGAIALAVLTWLPREKGSSI